MGLIINHHFLLLNPCDALCRVCACVHVRPCLTEFMSHRSSGQRWFTTFTESSLIASITKRTCSLVVIGSHSGTLFHTVNSIPQLVK